ncbi:hypothetical protein EG329_004767 [Mollisiaceae sp. DMI_Dod_QoI]|nr:hypothetical protein EG329_004767 [Helotiales sp. DMI_Dod_QoI]
MGNWLMANSIQVKEADLVIHASTMTEANPKNPPPSTSFISRRVNDSTFLIIEDDSYGEQPYIYIKIYPNHLLITDTGCNSPRQDGLSLTSLRQYIETYPLPLNNHQPLNPSGKKHYIILCSHCHYDHILGIPQLLSSNPTIIASSFSPSFLSKENLPTNSLCKYVHKPTPEYTISHFAAHLSYLTLRNLPPNNPPFRIQFLHIPGHTPDSLAWYDIDEHHLYIGDTFYERQRSIPIPELPNDDDNNTNTNTDNVEQEPIPVDHSPSPSPFELPPTPGAIIFPTHGGNWIQYLSSLSLLLSFTTHQNLSLSLKHRHQHQHQQHINPHHHHGNYTIPRVKISSGHLTHSADAETMILDVKALFERIIKGEVPVKGSGLKRT